MNTNMTSHPDLHPEAKRAIDNGALFVGGTSGGKDSLAMVARLIEMGVPTSQMVLVHAHLGHIEWPGALEKAKEQAEMLGVPFIVARAKRNLLEIVRDRYEKRPDVPSWPSSSARYCTSDLKRGPIEREVRRYAKANGYKIVVSCMGLRAEESPARKKRPVWSQNNRQTNSKREWFEYLPVHELSTEGVFATIERAGLTPHWAYAEGNERLSCVYCIFGSVSDLQNGAKHNPDLAREYIELEEALGWTMHMSRRPLAELLAETVEKPLSLGVQVPCAEQLELFAA